MPPHITNPVGRASSTGYTTAASSALYTPLVVGQDGPAPSEDSASSDSVEALCILIPGGRASPAGSAVPSALVVPFTLGQEAPASPEHAASSGSVETRCSAFPGGRTSPADFATAVTPALSLCVSFHRMQSQCSLCCPDLFLNEHIASDILALSLSAETSGKALRFRSVSG